MNRFVLFNVLVIAFFYCYQEKCSADIYKYVDENGVVHFTNAPNHKKYRLIIKDGRDSKYNENRYDHIIKNLCKKYSVETALVKAIIKAESDFDPNAVSKKGAQGLMQLMPQKARELSVSDPFDPHENLNGGISYLRNLLDTFNENIPLVLAAYNAGENLVLKENRVPPYQETRKYIKKVLEYKKNFQIVQ